MRFLTDEDYRSFITDGDLEAMLEPHDDEQIDPKAELLKCEIVAQEEIAGYLRNRYDVEQVFAPFDFAQGTPDTRSPIIIMYNIDVALYHLAARLPGRMNLEQREVRYDSALKWLDKVNKGQVQPALPLINENDPGNPVKWGGYKKQNSQW
jgi:phage gp36-like protein